MENDKVWLNTTHDVGADPTWERVWVGKKKDIVSEIGGNGKVGDISTQSWTEEKVKFTSGHEMSIHSSGTMRVYDIQMPGDENIIKNEIFDGEKKEFDKVYESHGIQIFCDVKSWIYVRGCEIDFSNDLLNGGFKVNNPNANRTCGCGISFSA
jgi:iron-sulfur cluster assembly protein